LEQSPGRTCDVIDWSPHRDKFSARNCDTMRDPHCNSVFLRDCTPWKGALLEGPTLGKFMKDYPMGGTSQ